MKAAALRAGPAVTMPRWLRVVVRISRSNVLAADLARFPDPVARRSPGVLAVMALRASQWTRRTGARRLLAVPVEIFATIVRIGVGIDVPASVAVGEGLVINHFGGIFVEGSARIGERCSLNQGVTIGNRVPGGPSPVIGDDVQIGAYAQVLGGITIGDGARIGAMAVVLCDVPAGATAVGNPARIS